MTSSTLYPEKEGTACGSGSMGRISRTVHSKYITPTMFDNVDRDYSDQITCLPDEDTRRSVRSYSASLPRPSNRIRSRRSTPGSRPMSANSWNSLGSSRNAMDDDLIIAIGSRGRGKGEFTNPQGVAVTSSGDILVCDSNSQCVQVVHHNKNNK